jgi:Rrf2 family transcriptional regulator, iron-sulfur cluster assembly transcription factor
MHTRLAACSRREGGTAGRLVPTQENAMKPNSKTRLAVDAMIDLALREQSGPVALATIARRQGVSLTCIEQVISRLRKAALVESTRGHGGGYSLGREAADISVADIVQAIENGAPDARRDDGRASMTHDLAQRLDAMMQVHMAGISLSDLVAGQQEAGVQVETVYPRRLPVAPRPPRRPVAAGVPNSVFDLGKTMAMSVTRSDRR